MSLPPQKIHFCTSRDGTRIAYATCGSGPPLVLLQHWIHHLDLDGENPIWRPWLSLLTRKNTLVRHDHRGCGLSDREGISFSFDKLLQDFEAVVAAAGVKRFVLCTMAGGAGAVGMSFAVRNPD